MKIKKSHGGVEDFSKHKLYSSLERTGLPENQCQRITDEVTSEIGEGSRTKDIYKKTLRLVKTKSPLAAVHYSLKRALFELGPSGHYFETYVARYFSELGFETTTCQTLHGKYVTHEVDVIAEKAGKATLIECKFHNRFGIKNDIKIALYVKARWDDLKEGPDGKRIESFVLASNTAFTKDALAYAEGTGLKLLGVNAPVSHSFLETIKDLRLYPVTGLQHLSKSQKNYLLSKNIILAKDIPSNRPLLRGLSMSAAQFETLEQEIIYLSGV